MARDMTESGGNGGSKWRNPVPTVDIVIEIDGGVVLIERRNEPRGWALPGGFVDYGEQVEDAARREAKEETGLDVELTQLLGVYSSPDRDPRQHTMSVVYIATALGTPRGGDDASRAMIALLDDLPLPLCFDHARILDDYARFRRTGLLPRPTGARAIGEVLTREDCERLLEIARDALEVVACGKARSELAGERSARLAAHAACFVTLRSDDQLRGCIGGLEPRLPLAEAVREMTAAAAMRDPRFRPVEAAEVETIRIDISVLGPPRVVASPAHVRIGEHGVIVRAGERRGVLLPQVALEHGWDALTFVEHTCLKAGLPSDAWQRADAVIEVFAAHLVAEDY